MALGPGRYDDIATRARRDTGDGDIVLIVLNGNKGSGFSVQSSAVTLVHLPLLLRRLADDIERDMGRQ